jgi:hypothetical protein
VTEEAARALLTPWVLRRAQVAHAHHCEPALRRAAPPKPRSCRPVEHALRRSARTMRVESSQSTISPGRCRRPKYASPRHAGTEERLRRRLAETVLDSFKTELIAGPRLAHPPANSSCRRRMDRLVTTPAGGTRQWASGRPGSSNKRNSQRRSARSRRLRWLDPIHENWKPPDPVLASDGAAHVARSAWRSRHRNRR